MGWASRHIEKLRAGETVSFRPHGRSMTESIQSRRWRVPKPTRRNREMCTWQCLLQEQARGLIDDPSQLRWFCVSPAMPAFTPLALATSVRSTAYRKGLAASL